jgi:hypothetical protein
MGWELTPEPADEGARDALLRAVEESLDEGTEAFWWRSGFDDLGGGPAAQQTWRDAGVVEP